MCVCVCEGDTDMHLSSWLAVMQHSLLKSKFDTTSLVHFCNHTSRAANNVGETLEVLFSAEEINFLVAHKHIMRTNTYTHPSTGPRVAPSGVVVEQVVSPMGCVLNPPGANREIVPLGQEPAHKDRKWNPST